ncbi:hypothetical protein [Bacillus sp. REN16]|uniref:hypothetical protein n=1 Tax=Bacillus sp. REN16 TaxID=2887296 RepID=UPI001E497C90|nr:hypothetical protein [Bacillus sp. REN16]MCC3359018.1 hypothetical protein [Bacillus sp. REN16]
MNYEWYQSNPMPFPYQQDYGQMAMMRKHGHGGRHHGGHGKPGHGGGHHGGHGKPSHGGFQGGLPFLGGLAGGLLAGSLMNQPGYYPYGQNSYYGYYPPYPPAPYPTYPYYSYPPYGNYY